MSTDQWADEELDRRRAAIARGYDTIERLAHLKPYDAEPPAEDEMDKWRREARESDERVAQARLERRENERRMRDQQIEHQRQMLPPGVDAEDLLQVMRVLGDFFGTYERHCDLVAEYEKKLAQLEFRLASLEVEFSRLRTDGERVIRLPRRA